MYHCSLAKTPALPLLHKLSKLRGGSNGRLSRCPAAKSYHRSAGIGVAECNVGSFPRRLGSWERVHGAKPRVYSSSLQQANAELGESNNADRKLPWIAAAEKEKRRKGVDKASDTRTKRSSWEEAAESFLARNETATTRDTRGSRSFAEEGHRSREEEEEDVKTAVNNPRWDKLKNRYRGFIGRESNRPDKPGTVRGWNKQENWGSKAPKDLSVPQYEKPEVRQWNKQENWGKKTWKEDTESTVPKMVGQAVYGVGPVLASLTARRREFYKLYVQEGLDLSGNNKKKKDKKAVEKVLKAAEKIGLKVVEASKHDLNMAVDNRPHQGLVLDASPLEMVSIRELDPVSVEGGKAPLWIALDEVTDPQNLGAIIRSSYFFGAQGVVLCAKNSAPLSGVVSKASAGSLELIELLSCKNMMQFLTASIENGWRVLGGSVSPKAVPLSDVEAGVPTILVLGSEGSGLRPLVERSCTQLIRIPGNIPVNAYEMTSEVDSGEMNQNQSGQELTSFLAVESLNVSVAAGVLLYHLAGKFDRCIESTPSDALT